MPEVLNIKTQKLRGIPNVEYVGRPSKWGNPYVIGVDGTREEVVQLYRERLKVTPALLNALEELRGKNLVCYCAPELCHADVLLELANA